MRVLTEPSRACGTLPPRGSATQREFVPVGPKSDKNFQRTFQDLITQLPPVKPTDALYPRSETAPVTSTDAVKNHKTRFMIGDAELFLNVTILVVLAAGVAALALDVDSTDAEKKRALDLK